MKVNVKGHLRLKMITKSVFIVIAIVLLLLGGGMLWDAHANISSAERDALIALYNSTNGDNWNNNSGWKDAPLDADGFAMPGTEYTWHGITCNEGNTTVLEINIYQNNLNGTIPPELGNLTNLTKLSLSSNKNKLGNWLE